VPGPGYEEDGWRLTSRSKLGEPSAMVGRSNFPFLILQLCTAKIPKNSTLLNPCGPTVIQGLEASKKQRRACIVAPEDLSLK